MKEKEIDGATAEISTPIYSEYTADNGDYYLRDHEGFKLAEIYNGKKAALIVKAVNEYEALKALEEAAKEIESISDIRPHETLFGYKARLLEGVRDAISNLDQLRKEGK